MRRNGSTRLAAIALVCLAASGSTSCCKTYAKATVEPCPKMSEALLLHVRDNMGLAEDFVADEMIPYCAGVDAINE